VVSYKDSPLENFKFKNLNIDAKIGRQHPVRRPLDLANTHIKTADGSVVKLLDCGNVTGLGER